MTDELTTALARRLYRLMPDAPPVGSDNGLTMWGDVECTEHWQFCHAIAAAIIEARGHARAAADALQHLSATKAPANGLRPF